MTTFAGLPLELEEALAYELQALEYFRLALFNEAETANESVTVTLGDVGENGRLNQYRSFYSHSDISAGAVQTALSRLRPLAFSAAFKAQDMIVEWILRANGKNDWKFKVKLQNYDQLSSGGSLVEPDFFASRPSISKAFWELFRYFEPYRGTVIHAGGVSVIEDGTLQVAKPGFPLLELTSAEQAAYIRVLCIVCKHLIAQSVVDSYLDAVIESAFARLIAYHGISAIQYRHIRYSHLKVVVPPDRLTSDNPLSVNVDCDQLRNLMRESLLMPEMVGEVFFSLTVEVRHPETVSRWVFPLDVVPTSFVVLTEGDPRFDRYLVHQGNGS